MAETLSSVDTQSYLYFPTFVALDGEIVPADNFEAKFDAWDREIVELHSDAEEGAK